jgi:hypothetical protein
MQLLDKDDKNTIYVVILIVVLVAIFVIVKNHYDDKVYKEFSAKFELLKHETELESGIKSVHPLPDGFRITPSVIRISFENKKNYEIRTFENDKERNNNIHFQVEKGDSMVKKKNNDTIILYKKDTLNIVRDTIYFILNLTSRRFMPDSSGSIKH